MEENGEIQQLRACQDLRLINLHYDYISRVLKLSFEDAKKTHFSVHLSGVLHLTISNTDDPALADVEILKTSAWKIEDGGREELNRLGYMWHDKQGNILIYPDSSLSYFGIEGDICLAVVCSQIEFRREQPLNGLSP